MSTATPVTVDVVIVGAGPNGLLAATELALAGVRPLVLEALPEPSNWPKANGLVGGVVAMLHYRGLYERISGSSRPPVPLPGFFFGALPFGLPDPGESTLYALPVPQRRLEEILETRARELGVVIRRGCEVTGLRQESSRVELDVVGGLSVQAQYLIGADGGHSLVRKLCGISFPGITDDSMVTRTGQVTIEPPVAVPGTGDLEIPGRGRLHPAGFTRTETGVFAYGMFQQGLYRVSVIEFDQPDPGPSGELPLSELRAAIHRVLGADIAIGEPAQAPAALTRTVGGRNSRQAERYRDGRVFLVGDAAHVHSGIGGPGLNLGMQDVFNLGWKLAAAVQGWAPAGLLNSYEAERIPAGQRVITHTRAQTALLSPGPNITALREVMAELLHEPAVARRIADLMSGADVRYDRPVGSAPAPIGSWLPDLTFTVDGAPTSVAQLARSARPLLIVAAGSESLADTGRDWADRVSLVQADDVLGVAASAVLVRPDGYVAWAGGSGESGLPGDGDEAGLRQALGTWFGAQAGRTAIASTSTS